MCYLFRCIFCFIKHITETQIFTGGSILARPFSNVLLVIFWTENDTEDNFFEPEKN